MDTPLVYWYRRIPGSVPMVLLHGFTGSPRSWDEVAAALPDGRSVVAIALPSHHPQAPVAPGFEANIDIMAAQLESAGCRGAHLVGYSLGARAALGLAARHPDLLGRLTLIGVHPGLPSERERAERMQADRVWIERLRTRGIAAFVAAWEAHPVFTSQSAISPDMLDRQRRIRLSHDAGALACSLEHMGLGAMPDHRPLLPRLAMPVTLVSGALDSKFTAVARELAPLLPAAKLSRLADCGHNPLIEQPRALAAQLADMP